MRLHWRQQDAGRRVVPSFRTPAGVLAGVLVLSAIPAGAQGGATVTGRVLSEYGSAIPGAVGIPELSITVQVRADGSYTLTIPSGRVLGQSVSLLAKAIGHRPQSRPITMHEGTQAQDFTLSRDINQLDRVVVVGASTPTSQKKMPFSAAVLDSSDMPMLGINALTAIQGKVPGATIVSPTGRPGSSPAIMLRGPKSIDGTARAQEPFVDVGSTGVTRLISGPSRGQEPLFILDGAILNGGTQDINPADIETIEVIKGAAATTLYGSRAGAGVIQITTKGGGASAQGTRFGMRTEFAMSGVTGEYDYARRHFLVMDETRQRFCVKVPTMPTCSRTVDLMDEAQRINDVASPAALPPQAFERDFGINAAPPRLELKSVFQVNEWPVSWDPIAQLVTAAATSSVGLDVSARSGSTGFNASASHVAQDGVFHYLRGYRRGTLRLNTDRVFDNGSSISLRSTYAQGTQYGAVDGSAGTYSDVTDEWFLGTTRLPPGVNLRRRDSSGRLYIRPNPLQNGATITNPLYNFQNIDTRLDDDRFIASLSIRHIATRWLSFEAAASTDRLRSAEDGFIDRDFRTVSTFGQTGGGTQGMIDLTTRANLSHNLMLSSRAEFSRGADLRGTIIGRFRLTSNRTWISHGATARASLIPGFVSARSATPLRTSPRVPDNPRHARVV